MQGKWPESVTCPSFRALWFSRRLAPAELEARTEKVLPFAARISPSDGTPTRWPLLAASRCSIKRASLVATACRDIDLNNAVAIRRRASDEARERYSCFAGRDGALPGQHSTAALEPDQFRRQ